MATSPTEKMFAHGTHDGAAHRSSSHARCGADIDVLLRLWVKWRPAVRRALGSAGICPPFSVRDDRCEIGQHPDADEQHTLEPQVACGPDEKSAHLPGRSNGDRQGRRSFSGLIVMVAVTSRAAPAPTLTARIAAWVGPIAWSPTVIRGSIDCRRVSLISRAMTRVCHV
jgi:hypothetical protein